MGKPLAHLVLLFFFVSEATGSQCPIVSNLTTILNQCQPKDLTYKAGFEYIPHKDMEWKSWAMDQLWAERANTSTPLIGPIKVPFAPQIDIYFKNEGLNPTGSLKHRFAWALVVWGIVEGYIKHDTHVIEASSGNTAASESYFVAGVLNLTFTSFVSKKTSNVKVATIEKHGGNARRVSGSTLKAAEAFAASCPKCFFMNQFGNSGKALDHFEAMGEHKSMNDFQEAIEAMEQRNDTRYKVPSWFVGGVGTGGTITSVGKFILRNQFVTKLAVVDSYDSVVYEYLTGKFGNMDCKGKDRPKFVHMAGIGPSGPMIEYKTTSLLRRLVSAAIKVADPFAIAAMRKAGAVLGVKVGPSTGLNLFGAMELARIMHREGKDGSILSLICDLGSRYLDTYHNKTWIGQQFATAKHLEGNYYVDCAGKMLDKFWESGKVDEKSVRLTDLGDCGFAEDRLSATLDK